MKANDLIDKLGRALNDTAHRRWTESDLRGYLTDAQRAIVAILPDANRVTETVKLNTGARQSLPAGGTMLLGPARNMGENGVTPGRLVQAVSKRDMDATDPEWTIARPSLRARHVVIDERSPRTFSVYPPQPETPGHLEISYAKLPETVTAQTTDLDLDDVYETPVIEYAIYLAHSPDTEAAEQQIAQAHYQQFTTILGAIENGEVTDMEGDRRAASQ